FAAFINIFGAIKYLSVGAVVGGGNKLVDMAAAQSKKTGEAFDEQKARDSMGAARAAIGAPPSVWVGYGAVLLVPVGASVAGAVCLFRSKAPKFCIIASALAIIAEVIGIAVFSFGIAKIFGIIGGGLGIFGARAIMARNAAPADLPPAAAPM